MKDREKQTEEADGEADRQRRVETKRKSSTSKEDNL